MKLNKKRLRFFRYLHPKLMKLIIFFLIVLAAAITLFLSKALPVNLPVLQPESEDTIKWVDFDVPYNVLEKTMSLDIESYDTEIHLKWTELLAYLGAKYGGNYRLYKSKDLDGLVERLNQGESITTITEDMKLYNYYNKAYDAILGGFLGEFMVQVPVDSETGGEIVWESKYGLKAFSPIPAGYWYSDYDDFGVGRSYGYNRKHFGHDMMIGIGTPIVAIESGIVEAMGWNQYGGWRIGIRSFDKQRYYYYAHLRKDRPYSADLYVGKAVKAGDVIGYSGRSGYSRKENVNNIDTPHLHVGIQLIFDEKLKDSPNQIWVDMYTISKLLLKNKCQVYKEEETKEFYRKYDFTEPSYFLETENMKDSAQKAETALLSSAAPEGSIPLPVVMYHGLIDEKKYQNQFFISPKIFEKDLKYFKKNNYTPIFIKDLINYVDRGVPLPEKPVLITFDDGYYNTYLFAYPLLREYNMKAVISVLGKLTEKYSQIHNKNSYYAYLTWDDIKELSASGYFEIQNHSYDMHNFKTGRNGSAQLPGESLEQYQIALNEDLGYMQDKIYEVTGQRPTAFAYPLGNISKSSKDILKNMGFRATFSCREGINYITRDPDCLYRLKRVCRTPEKSSEEFFKVIAPAHTSP
ncbi:MAG TPA: polysaccharide deacetylase family protein [Anaerovoracaceae bacterium]|nr:polysaccharide deacetylase family protein [Anaerovoracaceae bacterium]